MRDRLLKGTGILQAMITMDVMALATISLAAWAGSHRVEGELDSNARHVAWGLGTALLNLVARCIAIFYMLASGRAVKDLVAECGLDPAFVVRSKKIKRGVETMATLALVPLMVAAIGGGKVHVGGDLGPHSAWAWAAVAMAFLCLVLDVRAGIRNLRLLREVDDLVRALPEPGEKGSS